MCKLSVKEVFEKRLQDALELIDSYEIEYEELGVFGSYARGSYKATSDIDICIIGKKPEPMISGILREDADLLGVDIVFMTKDYLNKQETLLARNIKSDYMWIKINDTK